MEKVMEAERWENDRIVLTDVFDKLRINYA